MELLSLATMLITNILAYVRCPLAVGWSPWRALLGALPFFIVDMAFFTANLTKVVDGGWFPLVFGILMFIMLMTWKRGRALLQKRLAEDAIDLDPFITSLGYGGTTRVAGTAVLSDVESSGRAACHAAQPQALQALHERVVLVSANILDVPYVDGAQRVAVEALPNNFWRVRIFSASRTMLTCLPRWTGVVSRA